MLISGDTSIGAPSGYLRALNNTVYGSTVGIQIDELAAPALLNNALVGNETGVSIVGAGETLIRGMLFEDNGVDATTAAGIGDDAIIDPGAHCLSMPHRGRRPLLPASPTSFPMQAVR